MELLDLVPADAIALRLYSLPAAAATAGSLWAWLVAALAAAVGLWRIRAAGSGSKPEAPGVRSAVVDDKQQKRKKPRGALPSSVSAVDEARPDRAEAEAPVATPTSPMSEPSTPSKVRFTAYYGGSGEDANGVVDSVRRCAERDTDDNDIISGMRVDGDGETPLRRTASGRARRTTPTALMAMPWEEREMSVRRRGDLGWYRHLDMAVLDGSVVRLWDGEVTTAVASPRGRSRRRALSELHLSL